MSPTRRDLLRSIGATAAAFTLPQTVTHHASAAPAPEPVPASVPDVADYPEWARRFRNAIDDGEYPGLTMDVLPSGSVLFRGPHGFMGADHSPNGTWLTLACHEYEMPRSYFKTAVISALLGMCDQDALLNAIAKES